MSHLTLLIHCPQEPKPRSRAASELDVAPEDMDLACMESSDSALPEDFPPTASESQLSNMASSSTCLLSDEGHSATSQSTATATAMDMADSYQKLPPLGRIARCPTQQRMELMAQMPRSHSLPDLMSNIYEMQPLQNISPPNDAGQIYPVQFTEKPLLKAHQPKVCSSSYSVQHNELQMEQHRLPQVSTGNGQALVKSQVSAFFTPQKQGAGSGNLDRSLHHPKDGVRLMHLGPSHPTSGSMPLWAACGGSGVPTVAPRSDSTIVSIARLSLHSSSPSPITNPEQLTPPFTPSEVSAPPLPYQPCGDLASPFPSTAVKRNGSLPRQQVHIAPKSTSIDSGTAQQQLSNSFRRKRSRPPAPLEDKLPLLVQGVNAAVEQDLPSICHPPQQKQYR